jgi:hypothetical protein
VSLRVHLRRGRSLTTLCRRYVTVVGAHNVTDDPEQVTCRACLNALAAADKEAGDA